MKTTICAAVFVLSGCSNQIVDYTPDNVPVRIKVYEEKTNVEDLTLCDKYEDRNNNGKYDEGVDKYLGLYYCKR